VLRGRGAGACFFERTPKFGITRQVAIVPRHAFLYRQKRTARTCCSNTLLFLYSLLPLTVRVAAGNLVRPSPLSPFSRRFLVVIIQEAHELLVGFRAPWTQNHPLQ
jgi:hypothetical protein